MADHDRSVVDMDKSSVRLTWEEEESPWLDEPSPLPVPAESTVRRYLNRVRSALNLHGDCPACQDRICPTPERLVKLRTMPYGDYLRTREWAEARRNALARASYRCQLCGQKEGRTFHVHHNTYARRGHEWPSDLVVLCATCHERHHDL